MAKKHSSLHHAILWLAIPNVISNISEPLLSSVDTGLMGTLSARHIGAVGLGAMLFNFLYWNLSFLRMGTTGMTAQAFGRQDQSAIAYTLLRALLLGSVLGLVLLSLKTPLLYLGSSLMNVPNAQAALVTEYFSIRLLAAPATLILMALMGWFFGLQNVWFPLLLTLIINTTNILLSYWLVKVQGWGVAGVAYGTVGAQYLGALVGLGLVVARYRGYFYGSTNAQRWNWPTLLEPQAFKRFLHINSDIFIRTFCLTLVFGFFYSQSAVAGGTILAVNTILMQFLNWMSYGVDGFAYAAESLVGRYTGAEERTTTRRVIRLSLYWGMALAVLFSLLYAFAGPWLGRALYPTSGHPRRHPPLSPVVDFVAAYRHALLYLGRHFCRPYGCKIYAQQHVVGTVGLCWGVCGLALGDFVGVVARALVVGAGVFGGTGSGAGGLVFAEGVGARLALAAMGLDDWWRCF